MNMKSSFGYDYYIIYLKEKVNNNIITDNQFEMLKSSYHNYGKFINRLNSDIDFKNKMKNKYKEYIRLSNIDKLLNDEDNIK